MANWYKIAKSNTPKAFLAGVALGLIPLTTIVVSEIMKVPQIEAEQILKTNPKIVLEEARKQADILERYEPRPKVQQPVSSPKSTKINMDRIVQIESGGNPNAISPVGARGLTQITESTWYEAMEKMGKNWSFDEAFDSKKNIMVGNWYFNKRIPQMLNHYGIEDSVETRIAAYNWGIGNLLRAWKEKGADWKKLAPDETINYIKKYNN